jgi:hypothetical protein
MFKWVCLGVAVVALAAYGWMLNDMRLEVKRVAEKADSHLPQILTQSEQVSTQLDRHLPRLLSQTEQAANTINNQLPTLLTDTENATLSIAELSGDVKEYKGLLGVVHGASKDEGLFSYGLSLLGMVGGQKASIGVKKSPADTKLHRSMPAKTWANAARKDLQFLSVSAKSKGDVLHGLARTYSVAALHIQIGDQPPRPLAEWLKEVHADSKNLE